MAGNSNSENESGNTDGAAGPLEYLQDPVANEGLDLLHDLLQSLVDEEIHEIQPEVTINFKLLKKIR